jgi:general secretion pathway protein I
MRHRPAGFTLLEVLVALAILGVAVVAVIQGFAQGLRLLKVSGDHQHAMLLADLKLREVVAPEETHEQGVEGDFQWARWIRRLETPELMSETGVARWHVYEITVRVSWDERRQVELATLRTVSPEATVASGTTPRRAGQSAARQSPSRQPLGVRPPQ